jgi:hypothetical protein
MSTKYLYKERLTSNWTEALFIILAMTFAALAWWQFRSGRDGFFAILFSFLGILFLLYVLNYRVLRIVINSRQLTLKFGVFSHSIPFNNIDSFELDELPWLMKYGGAGIHFMMIRGRYRASFNFLEHPRVVIALRKKTGWVRDISFSTQNPDQILGLLQQHVQAE